MRFLLAESFVKTGVGNYDSVQVRTNAGRAGVCYMCILWKLEAKKNRLNNVFAIIYIIEVKLIHTYECVAQLVEQNTFNVLAGGSSPLTFTIKNVAIQSFRYVLYQVYKSEWVGLYTIDIGI